MTDVRYMARSIEERQSAIKMLFFLLCFTLSSCFPNTVFAGDGIIDNFPKYYKGKVETRHRTEKDLPVIDFLAFRRDFSDEVLYRMKKINFIPQWHGGEFNSDYCTRYELAYLTGRLWRLITNTFGMGFNLRPAGPRSFDLSLHSWGQEDVRIAIRSGLFKFNGSKEWWSKPISAGTFARYLIKIVRELRKFTPVVVFPLPFPPDELKGSFPDKSDPRYPALLYVYKTGLMSMKSADNDSKASGVSRYSTGIRAWDVRNWISKREVIEAMDRFIYIIYGYREPLSPPKPDKEYPLPRTG